MQYWEHTKISPAVVAQFSENLLITKSRKTFESSQSLANWFWTFIICKLWKDDDKRKRHIKCSSIRTSSNKWTLNMFFLSANSSFYWKDYFVSKWLFSIGKVYFLSTNFILYHQIIFSIDKDYFILTNTIFYWQIILPVDKLYFLSTYIEYFKSRNTIS